jgi:hypothetical protein
MVIVRPYTEADAVEVGHLIAEDYARYNLSFAGPEALRLLLGPLQHV